ncbi:MAG: ABC transporter permease [Bacillota bacterium]
MEKIKNTKGISSLKKTCKRFFAFLKSSPKFATGLIILLFLLTLTLFAGLFTVHDPMFRYDGLYHTAPSSDHILGTTRLGRDVWSQTLYGGRKSIAVGLLAAGITTILAMTIGISSGYIGGMYDNIISIITNVMMVIPSLVLLLIIAAMMGSVSPVLICLVIGFTSWPWGARVLRAQTMSIRNRDFVRSAETLGESKIRILFFEIMPNMLSIISSSFVSTMIYAITAHATMEIIGFGDSSSVTWGMIINNAKNSGAFYSGYWWEIAGAVIGLVMLGLSLTLINFAIDEISNPKLKAQRIMKSYYKARKLEERAKRKLAKNKMAEEV